MSAAEELRNEVREVILRSEARSRGLKRYFTGKPCKNGHVVERFVSKGTCAACLVVTSAAWKASNAESIKETRKQYLKLNAGRIKEQKLQYRLANNAQILEAERRRRAGQDKEKRRLILKSWRERNAERRSKYMREWREANPELTRAHKVAGKAKRRAAMAHEPDAPALIAEWVRAVTKACHWCGVKCASGYHIDHYVPLAKGGRHVVKNLVIACQACNQKKNAKDPYEFAASLGRLF